MGKTHLQCFIPHIINIKSFIHIRNHFLHSLAILIEDTVSHVAYDQVSETLRLAILPNNVKMH